MIEREGHWVVCRNCGRAVDKDEAYKWDARESIYASGNALCPKCAKRFYKACDLCDGIGHIQKKLRFPRIQFIPKIGWDAHLIWEKRERFHLLFEIGIQIRETITCPMCNGSGNLKWGKEW